MSDKAREARDWLDWPITSKDKLLAEIERLRGVEGAAHKTLTWSRDVLGYFDTLTAENERLEAVVEAARSLVEIDRQTHRRACLVERCEMCNRIDAAAAALSELGGEE